VTKYRLHVWPWLRPIGAVALKDWLAITIGNHILAWRPLNEMELEHELAHVRQWSRLGLAFPVAYLAHSLRARRAGKRWYQDNPFEKEARETARRRSGPDAT
jgi:hypothetical protein